MVESTSQLAGASILGVHILQRRFWPMMRTPPKSPASESLHNGVKEDFDMDFEETQALKL